MANDRAEVTKSVANKEILRVALDKKATQAVGAMTNKMKEANYPLKLNPSQFVSFLVHDFFETYFEKDIEVLIAAFFDSHKYLNTETQAYKGKGNYEESMRAALAKAENIRAGKRNGGHNKNRKTRQVEPKDESV